MTCSVLYKYSTTHHVVLNPEREDEVNMELRAAREASGKTQAQVAKEIGLTEVSYQRIEYGIQRPSLTTAIRLARALSTTVESLFGAATPDREERR